MQIIYLVDKLNESSKSIFVGPRFAHLSKTAIAYLQMSCNFLPVLPQQLGQKFDIAVKRSKIIPFYHHLNKLGRPCIPDAT